MIECETTNRLLILITEIDSDLFALDPMEVIHLEFISDSDHCFIWSITCWGIWEESRQIDIAGCSIPVNAIPALTS